MQKTAIQSLVYIAAFAALIIVLGAVSIPVGAVGVPIVLQNMGIALAGMLLGWRRGTLSVVLFLAVGLIGVPNLAGFRTTLSALPGTTVGYLVGYIVAALVIGLLTERRPRGNGAMIGLFTAAGLVGVLVQYLFGTFGLMVRAEMGFVEALLVNVPFIPGDIVKVVVAALIAAPVLRAFPDLRANTAATAATAAR
ncbi:MULTISPECIES: biotin transporter BioY [Corynebacterium]|uniref:Biotin transporter n=2 Tax=Corynebacterium freneyi TaxID=134034 RepID=A0A096A7W0_9CORY|nr:MULTISPECIES: biotin transporter BioY [Corynebacterium]KGF16964.1 biotin biosynthesis protein BioY [Corynebacterium freneyi DNF00450]MBP2332694.1 biotin transport system substrate-specific component [Corynebacterium freneyi]MCG7438745.1 biotin transporter BioY [Corynebacterium freneyi]OFU57210.1 biotin biosynthesis protein BioY [Corynebacterium sp. HMSC11E11]QXA53158.1 biotin transporter BioY [Corynebacterium freneyi]